MRKGGVDEAEVAETAEQFVGLSLTQRDEPVGSIRLHDLQLDYVRAQWACGEREALDLIHGAAGPQSRTSTENGKSTKTNRPCIKCAEISR